MSKSGIYQPMLKFQIIQIKEEYDMKRTLTFLLFIFAAIPCSAQWKSIFGNGYSNGSIFFGVHDLSLFISTGAPSGWYVARYLPNGLRPNITCVGQVADTGMNFTQGNVTSFAALGSY